MAWRDDGPAITFEGSGVKAGGTTSTIVVPESFSPVSSRLVMFGVDSHQLAAELGIDWESLREPPAFPAFNVWDSESPDPAWGHLQFLESGSFFPFSGAPAFSYTTRDAPFFRSTVIPAVKRHVAMTWAYERYSSASTPLPDATLPVDVRYKDPSIVRLPSGRGRLFLTGRLMTSPVPSPTSPPDSPEASFADIVAFWAPEADPTFSSRDVRGPFRLVDGMDAVPGLTGARLWLGVPSAVVAKGADGAERLFVYFVAEAASFLQQFPNNDIGSGSASWPDYVAGLRTASFVRGIHLRTVELADLYAHIEHCRANAATLGDYTDERAWRMGSIGEPSVVPGTNRGRVRFSTTDGLDLNADDATWNFVDPSAATCEGELFLYFTVHPSTADQNDAHLVPGIWRAHSPRTARHGVDFLVYIVGDPLGDWLSPDQVVEDGRGPESIELHADPDAVDLRTGEWCVFVVAPDLVLRRIVGTDMDACATRWEPPFSIGIALQHDLAAALTEPLGPGFPR
jgi:hypothetical protein